MLLMKRDILIIHELLRLFNKVKKDEKNNCILSLVFFTLHALSIWKHLPH